MAARPRGTDTAQVIKVIKTTALVGGGEENDLCRIVEQYWTLSGSLIATVDPYLNKKNEQQELLENQDLR